MALATASVLQVPLRRLLWLGSLSLLNFAVDLMRQSYKSKSQQICFLVDSTADALGGWWGAATGGTEWRSTGSQGWRGWAKNGSSWEIPFAFVPFCCRRVGGGAASSAGETRSKLVTPHTQPAGKICMLFFLRLPPPTLCLTSFNQLTNIPLCCFQASVFFGGRLVPPD